MNKYLLFLVTWILSCVVFSQNKPFFNQIKDTTVLKNFPLKKYSKLPANTAEWKSAYQLAEFIEAKVPSEIFLSAYNIVKSKFKNKVIIQNFLHQEANKWKYLSFTLLDSIFNIDGSFPEFENLLIIDFDQDDKADVIGYKKICFGPTEGYLTYARTIKGFVPFTSMTGDFVKLDKNKDYITFYFAGGIIEPNETCVQILYAFDLKKKYGKIEKQYYAQQTVFPVNYLVNMLSSFTTNEDIILRYSPLKIDTGGEQDTSTKTIVGNIVAKLGRGTSFYILAENGDFHFIITTFVKVNETSLNHGMDSDFNESTNTIVRKGPVTFIGWVPKIKID